MNWYKVYFGKDTQEVKAHLDQKGRLFICDIIDGLSLPQDHDCDVMGCGSVGPHIHSVYLNARKYYKLQAENEMLTGLLEAALPNIECTNSFQSGLITKIGEFFAKARKEVRNETNNNLYN